MRMLCNKTIIRPKSAMSNVPRPPRFICCALPLNSCSKLKRKKQNKNQRPAKGPESNAPLLQKLLRMCSSLVGISLACRARTPARNQPRSAYRYVPLSDLRVVVLRRMLSSQTESSSMSRACAGLTELDGRRLSSPETRPWTASRRSKPNPEGVPGGDGVEDAERGKLSGCWAPTVLHELSRGSADPLRAWAPSTLR